MLLPTRPVTTEQAARISGPRGRSALVALWLVAALAVAMRPATAQPLDTNEALACELSADSNIVCRLNVSGEFDQEIRALVENGFTNEFVYHIYLFPAQDDEPIAIGVAVLAELFQLYSDIYYVSREGVEGYLERRTWAEAVEALSRFELTLESSQAIEPGEYFAAGVLEINPVNEAQLLEARRWIAQSRGGYRLFEQNDSAALGTLWSLFVNVDLTSADARRVIRSETFELRP